MVSVSVPGMYGLGNPSAQAARRPWTGSLPQERFKGAFFLWRNRVVTTSPRQQGQALKTARCPNDQGQCWACPMGWARYCQVVVCLAA
jgi:hypothetical protein